MHQVEGLVDVVERQGVGDHGIDFDLSLHIPIDDFRHVRTAARAAEGGAAPHSPGDQLKRPCRDFLTSAGNADNNALAPTAVAALQRRAHQIDVADAFERVIGAADLIGAAFGHVDEMRHEITADVFRIDEMRHAEAFAPGLLRWIGVYADNHVGADEAQTLDHIEPNAAEAEDNALRARLDLGGVDDGADAGSDAAADVADLIERSVLADFRYRDFVQHGVIRECRTAHVVVDFLAPDGEARRAVRHDALALGGADGGAEIGFARQAGRASAALRRIERDDMVALADRCHTGTDIDDNACALVAKHRREKAFRIGPRQCELVGVTHARCLDLDEHLTGAWTV